MPQERQPEYNRWPSMNNPSFIDGGDGGGGRSNVKAFSGCFMRTCCPGQEYHQQQRGSGLFRGTMEACWKAAGEFGSATESRLYPITIYLWPMAPTTAWSPVNIYMGEERRNDDDAELRRERTEIFQSECAAVCRLDASTQAGVNAFRRQEDVKMALPLVCWGGRWCASARRSSAAAQRAQRSSYIIVDSNNTDDAMMRPNANLACERTSHALSRWHRHPYHIAHEHHCANPEASGLQVATGIGYT